MRRVKINLAVFAVLATVTIAWSFTTLFSIDQLENPYVISAEFESSPGLAPGFEVTYLGTSIGSVKSVDLAEGMSIIDLKIDNGVELPADLDAAARRKSAIGEPYVDLSPRDGTDPDRGPRLEAGTTIPLERTTVPISYADLFASVDGLVDVIDPEQLETMIHEIAVALDGRGDELRTLVVGADDLTEDLVVHADEIDQFLLDLADIAQTAAEHRDSIETSLDSLTELADSLSDIEGPVDDLLAEAPPMVRILNNIFTNGDAGLLCTLDGLAVLQRVATPEILGALSNTLHNAPEISRILEDVLTPERDLDVDLIIDALSAANAYPTKVDPPTAPVVPGCEDFDVDFVDTDASDRAGVGPGGDDAFPEDGTLEVPGVTDDVEVGLAGSSDLDEPDEPLLAKILGLAIPAAAAGLLAVLAWFLFGLVRDRRNAAG